MELSRAEAQHDVLKLQFDRLDGVSKSKPGLVAQQEVDDAHAKDLATEAQVEGAKTARIGREPVTAAQAKREHDQVLFDYRKSRRRSRASSRSASRIWERWCRRAPVPARRPCRLCGSRRTIYSAS